MASNSFGNLFRITTWGESHGPAVGVVIDGCPPGIPITEEEINADLAKRAPGSNMFVSQRQEPDVVEILSGVFENKTTGAPISLLIRNKDARSDSYTPLKDLFRPGHAGFSYVKKYGIYDYRGGGRASARETACRVAAATLAKKILAKAGIQICAYLSSVGSESTSFAGDMVELQKNVAGSSIFCPNRETEARICETLTRIREEGNSIGGQVSVLVDGVPPGLGDPIYEKLEARLAFALMSIPASRAFEMGEGVHSGVLLGSEHNDSFQARDGTVLQTSNHAGGVLAGISTGAPLQFRVTFKPTSSIKIAQKTTTVSGENIEFTLPEGSRHDPCVAIRAVPVVEAMTALVLADSWLMQAALTS